MGGYAIGGLARSAGATLLALAAACGRGNFEIVGCPDGGGGGSGGDGSAGGGGDGGMGPDAPAAGGVTPPIAAFTIFPATSAPGVAVTFDAGPSRDREDPFSALAFDWDFDADGTFDASGPTANHAFAAAGAYPVTLRVADTDGLAHYIASTVDVVAATQLIVVDSAGDTVAGDGVTTLREAITAANGMPGAAIAFAAPMTILLGSNLPAIAGSNVTVSGGRGVVIDGGGTATQCLPTASGATGTRITWLEIRNCGDAIVLQGSSEQVRECKLHDNGNEAIDAKGSASTIGPHVEMYGNTASGMKLSAAGSTVFESVIHTNGNDGIRIEIGASNPVVWGNVIYDNLDGIISAGSISNVTIWHNTIRANRANGVHFSTPTGSTGHDVRNNILSSNAQAGIVGTGATFASLGYNAYFANASACSGCSVETATLVVDPTYVDPAGGDLRLLPGSGCIDNGAVLSVDVNGPAPGTHDGAAPDRGAREAR